MHKKYDNYEAHVSNSGFVWRCVKCGALVGNTTTHNAWHDILKESLGYRGARL